MSTAQVPDQHDEVVDAADRLVAAVLDDLQPALLERSGRYRTSAKFDGTPVTTTDLLVDERLADAIHADFAGHDILSEEGTTTWSGNEWTWIVDPIDGTSNFAAGLPYWAVSVALAHRGQPIYGCVAAPALGERFIGRRGQGAYLVDGDGTRTPLKVRATVDFRNGRSRHVPIAVTAGTIRRSTGTSIRLNPRIMGAWALDLALVAAGRLVGSYATVPKVWDLAAGALLVEEAGGATRTLGTPLLPLRRDVDYATTSAPLATGPDDGWVADLVKAIA
jgi:myo-inositol-1(or 4)-monophosphatase